MLRLRWAIAIFWLTVKFVCIENQQVIVFIIIGDYFVENSIRKKN